MSTSYLNASTLIKTTWPAPARQQRPRPSTVVSEDPLLTTREAAVILKVSVDALKKWRQRGLGPAFLKYDSGAIRYRLSVLLQYVSDCTAER